MATRFNRKMFLSMVHSHRGYFDAEVSGALLDKGLVDPCPNDMPNMPQKRIITRIDPNSDIRPEGL